MPQNNKLTGVIRSLERAKFGEHLQLWTGFARKYQIRSPKNVQNLQALSVQFL